MDRASSIEVEYNNAGKEIPLSPRSDFSPRTIFLPVLGLRSTVLDARLVRFLLFCSSAGRLSRLLPSAAQGCFLQSIDQRVPFDPKSADREIQQVPTSASTAARKHTALHRASSSRWHRLRITRSSLPIVAGEHPATACPSAAGLLPPALSSSCRALPDKMQRPPLQKVALRLWHLLNRRPAVVPPAFRLFSTAQAIADELLKPDETSEPLEERLDALNAALDHRMFVDALNLSYESGRKIFGFYEWAAKRPGFLDEASFAAVVDFLGRRKDFKAVRVLLLDRTLRRFPIGMNTFRIVVDRLARAGRPTQVIDFFHKIDMFGFEINRREGLSVVVSALCDHGFAGHAESLVKKTADQLFPDDAICETLVKGWCTAGKFAEARRLAGEVARGGFELGAAAYNAILDCICKLCQQKDPFRLRAEADTVLVEMEAAGVPRDSGTFRVLISNLCKIRKTQDALEIFQRMPEWSCSPDSDTFLALVKSLYQAARVAEGDEMLDSMKSAGFQLTIKDYYGFIRILCGIERVEHAMKVFARMKDDGFEPGTQTYELLVARLYAHGKLEAAKSLYQEAVEKGVTINNQEYKIEPRFVKEEKKKKKKAQRLTLPMKMERKRKRLRKLRLSFVKKPKKFMRRAY